MWHIDRYVTLEMLLRVPLPLLQILSNSMIKDFVQHIIAFKPSELCEFVFSVWQEQYKFYFEAGIEKYILQYLEEIEFKLQIILFLEYNIKTCNAKTSNALKRKFDNNYQMLSEIISVKCSNNIINLLI